MLILAEVDETEEEKNILALSKIIEELSWNWIELSVSLRQASLRQGWTVACTSVFTCCAVPQR